jgi:hypothetical protein
MASSEANQRIRGPMPGSSRSSAPVKSNNRTTRHRLDVASVAGVKRHTPRRYTPRVAGPEMRPRPSEAAGARAPTKDERPGQTGGGGGIRTHGGREPTHAFEACSFGRSDTPPRVRLPDLPRAAESPWIRQLAFAVGALDRWVGRCGDLVSLGSRRGRRARGAHSAMG